MTEREIQLVSELDSEKERNRKIVASIKRRQENLKKSDVKIAELGLAIKEEQLNSIRESIDKHGIDFESFRTALEQGLLNNFKINISEKDNLKTEETSNENE